MVSIIEDSPSMHVLAMIREAKPHATSPLHSGLSHTSHVQRTIHIRQLPEATRARPDCARGWRHAALSQVNRSNQRLHHAATCSHAMLRWHAQTRLPTSASFIYAQKRGRSAVRVPCTSILLTIVVTIRTWASSVVEDENIYITHAA